MCTSHNSTLSKTLFEKFHIHRLMTNFNFIWTQFIVNNSCVRLAFAHAFERVTYDNIHHCIIRMSRHTKKTGEAANNFLLLYPQLSSVLKVLCQSKINLKGNFFNNSNFSLIVQGPRQGLNETLYLKDVLSIFYLKGKR